MNLITLTKSFLIRLTNKLKITFQGDLVNMVIREKYEGELKALIEDLFELGQRSI